MKLLERCGLGGRLVFGAYFLFTIGFAARFARPAEPPSFQNFEDPVVHPIDLSPNGLTLAVCNLPDSRLEIFDLNGGLPVRVGSVPVGIDPVSVRFLNNGEAWVTNHISDSVSVVDIAARRVIATLQTKDEPCDVVFASGKAFVSCSQVNTIQVFNAGTRQLTNELTLTGEDPRAMAVSPDGTKVYVAIFESGNHTTILSGGLRGNPTTPPKNVVNDVTGPYGGVNPPRDNANPGNFVPPINPAVPTPIAVSLIVRKAEGDGKWRDFQGTDWTEIVSGSQSAKSDRPAGWDLYDHDLAVIDAAGLGVTYATYLMNLCMAVGVNPATGIVSVVGTDATNEVRFEPNLRGTFTRVNLALVDPSALTKSVVDLNSDHLSYLIPTLPIPERNKSIGDPRGIAWKTDGTRGYVTGMGSNNLIIIDDTGARAGAKIIPVGEGPMGVVYDPFRNRVYVHNRFESTISVIDAAAETEILPRVRMHDASPEPIKIGRKHLYDTHKNSGLGQISCASCHVDGRMDRLSWDLGSPSGGVKSLAQINLGANMPFLTTGFEDFHPMKGPMLTQTFQDIIGHEPFHWRGDRLGLEEFNPAFMSLQANHAMLNPQEMQEFEDFLATIEYPPNPFRKIDNTLPSNLPLPGHYSTGRHGPAGLPLPDGNPQHGLDLYRGTTTGNPNTRRRLDGAATPVFTCVQCHTLPTGAGTDYTIIAGVFAQIPPDVVTGARHLSTVSVDPVTNRAIKNPQLRNMHERGGFEFNLQFNLAGFGFRHDGAVDSLARFLDSPGSFNTASDQELADIVAFSLCLSGSDLPEGNTTADTTNSIFEPPGPPSKDAHAAMGKQVTISGPAATPMFGFPDIITEMIALADAQPGRIDLVVHGVKDGIGRGWFYDRVTNAFLSDRDGETITVSGLRALAAPGAELTYTAVYRGGGRRLGNDRDEDGFGDQTELDHGSNPADALSLPFTDALRWNLYE